ncbi:MAG: bifunctional methylenetetrahydrofolate dehydrogenase/methenyltetrahydrofolate cyclohydrolase FolD [Gemmatimonadaceae bacterium]
MPASAALTLTGRGQILDGAAIARTIRGEVAERVHALVGGGVRPGLAVVLVGDDPASAVYVRAKTKACDEAGMHSVTIRLGADTPEGDLLAHVDALNSDPAIHGILVQMPLPRHINAQRVVNRVVPEKDVDGFHPVNVGKLLSGSPDGFAPCTPAGIVEMLTRSGIPTSGAECVIVGRSNIVGKPMAALMMQDRPGGNATVTICHSRTRDLERHVQSADIVIAAIGRPEFISGAMIKEGAVVIDVGINRIADPAAKNGHRLVGDVDFASARARSSAITPVPGGVGPMTIAMLLANTVRAASPPRGAQA